MKAVETNNKSSELNLELGFIYLRMKKFNESISIYKKVLNNGDDEEKALSYYNTACAYSLTKFKFEAINNLKEAVILNKKYIKEAVNDKDFENIKNEKAFKNLVVFNN